MYFIKFCDAVINDAWRQRTIKQINNFIAKTKLKHISDDNNIAMFFEYKQKYF